MRERQKEHYTLFLTGIQSDKELLSLTLSVNHQWVCMNKVVLARCLLVWIPFINTRQVYKSKSKVYCKSVSLYGIGRMS